MSIQPEHLILLLLLELSRDTREVHFEYSEHRKYRKETQNHQVSNISQLLFNLKISKLADTEDHLTFNFEPFSNILKCGNVHLKVSHQEFW